MKDMAKDAAKTKKQNRLSRENIRRRLLIKK